MFKPAEGVRTGDSPPAAPSGSGNSVAAVSETGVLIAVSILGILLALVVLGLMLGPGEPSDESPDDVDGYEAPISVPGEGRDRRAGGPAFRAAALADLSDEAADHSDIASG